jgi:hypothetical protein
MAWCKRFCSAYSDRQELLSLIRFTLVNVKTHLIIEVEADSYHAAKKNVLLGQAKIDDCDNDGDYYHQQWERDNNEKRRR